MKKPAFVFDSRMILDGDAHRQIGFKVISRGDKSNLVYIPIPSFHSSVELKEIKVKGGLFTPFLVPNADVLLETKGYHHPLFRPPRRLRHQLTPRKGTFVKRHTGVILIPRNRALDIGCIASNITFLCRCIDADEIRSAS